METLLEKYNAVINKQNALKEEERILKTKELIEIKRARPEVEKNQELFNAIKGKNLKLAQLYIDIVANVNATDENGRTPLFGVWSFLERFQSLEMTKLLIENGANVNATKSTNESIINSYFLIPNESNSDEFIK